MCYNCKSEINFLNLDTLNKLNYLEINDNSTTYNTINLNKYPKLKTLYIHCLNFKTNKDNNNDNTLIFPVNHKLKIIGLYGCKFNSSFSLNNLLNLQYCYMSHNTIDNKTYINFDKCISLTYLIINEHVLYTLPNLDNLTNLTHLNLMNNRLNILPDIEKLINLTYLNVSYNDLENLPNIDNLINLTYLNVSYNDLENLPNIDNLINLKTYII